MKKYFLFDLDGTLTNTKEGIIKGLVIALGSVGKNEKDLSKLERFIGPPLKKSFMNFYNLNSEQADLAIEKYREYYKDKGMYECALYGGMDKLLRKLREEAPNVKICVATSKPQYFAEKILEHCGVRDCFDVIVGATMDHSRVEKADIIAEVMRLCPEYEKSEMIMIGDRKYDIEGAKLCEIESVGVRFGFAEGTELEDAGADYIVYTVSELEEKLIKFSK